MDTVTCIMCTMAMDGIMAMHGIMTCHDSGLFMHFSARAMALIIINMGPPEAPCLWGTRETLQVRARLTVPAHFTQSIMM